jgi:hypothetical protein
VFVFLHWVLGYGGKGTGLGALVRVGNDMTCMVWGGGGDGENDDNDDILVRYRI